MNTPQATHQQTQPHPPENACLPAEAPQRIEDEGTPSKASEVLGEVRLSPFELGDAIGVVPTADRGLQLMYCVTRPDLPGGGINEYQHLHIHQYREGNELLSPPVDVFWDAMEMAYGWCAFKTFAINHFTNQNATTGNQIRATQATPALTWQGLMAPVCGGHCGCGATWSELTAVVCV
ncbi:hypothetical protein PCANC_05071 [Puccinia coronata f. sp. avenae]|uniref:Uncharacterized protein n=1 Tax=Puccinia coronata f. sp. avenae TaxID=200324 RepID=A0A2N5T774_9BASI|nr:hypothetical protein PCANC_05071 [Puccinia coronata f. sp. avenae]